MNEPDAAEKVTTWKRAEETTATKSKMPSMVTLAGAVIWAMGHDCQCVPCKVCRASAEGLSKSLEGMGAEELIS